MASQLIAGHLYDVNTHLAFTKPKLNKSNGKNVGILNKECSKATTVTTPLMLTWGLQERIPDTPDGRVSYDFALQFPNDDSEGSDTSKFLKNMQAFEDAIKAEAVKNSKDWFGKASMSPEVVDALWTPMLKYPKNKETGEPDYDRAPTLKVKVPYWENEFKIELYNTNEEMVYPNDSDVHPSTLLEKSTMTAVCIQNGGIWFAGGKFGTTWRLVQAVVQPKVSLRGKCHISLSQKERTNMETHNAAVAAANEESNEVQVDVADSDDEDGTENNEVAAAPDPDPEPAPVKKKRVVKKKGGD